MNPRFAAIQMSSTDEVSENLAAAGHLLQQAVADGAVLAVLPENFAGFGLDESFRLRLRLAEPDGAGPIQEWLAAAASRMGIWIVGGTIPIEGDGGGPPAASCLVFDDAGRRVGRYDKIHLFDVAIPGQDETYRESANTRAGTDPLVVDTPWGRMGCGVCYDLRFPEMFRFLSAEGMDFLALPAAFTEATGRAHWRTIIRARAIENLCYVVAADQGGAHPGGRRTYGHSMIVGPWGETLAEMDSTADGEVDGCIVATIDLDRVQKLRREFPVLLHRRFAVHGPD
jgi:predicted amidohydrolase